MAPRTLSISPNRARTALFRPDSIAYAIECVLAVKDRVSGSCRPSVHPSLSLECPILMWQDTRKQGAQTNNEREGQPGVIFPNPGFSKNSEEEEEGEM